MSEDVANHDPQSTTRDDGEISILDLAIVLAKHKKLILGLPFVIAIVAAGLSLLKPDIYTAATKILPPQQQNQSAVLSVLGQLGAAGLGGGLPGIKSPNEVYVAMLKSRTVADNLIQRFGLTQLYDAKYASDTRKALEGVTNIISGKDGVITIEVDDKDPKRAAELANAYVDELYKLTQVLAVTEASQRRLFFERQLELARKNLDNSENLARQGLDKGGLVIVDAQGRAMAETTAKLRAQISVKELQISMMRAFAADRNPDLQQAQFELEAMKKELSRIEGPARGGDAKSAIVPGGMDTLNLLREVRYRETIVELLTRQYELAKIDEAKESSVVQVMDKAIEPDRKSKPKRSLIVLFWTLLAGFFAVLWALVSEALSRARENPEQSRRLQTFRGYLTGK